jgi:hypothetical protein
MPQVLAQPALQRVLQVGIRELKEDISMLDSIFEYYLCPAMIDDYGQSYIDSIKSWFSQTKIPVVQSWSLNPQKAPQISIHLAAEQEDEGKSAIGDFYDQEMGAGVDHTTGVGVFSVQMDIGIHGNRNGDEVLWLYYIVNNILFRKKRFAESLGLQLHSFSASDYNKRGELMAENQWVRWLRFRCTVENFFEQDPLVEITDVIVDPAVDGYEDPDDGETTPI